MFLTNKSIKLLVIAISLVFCFTTFAEETSDDDLMSFSFEQLLDLEVSIASTQTENILTTPAVVSKIDVQSMREMGLHSLSDIIAMLPGANVQHTGIGTRSIMLRGIFEAFNQKVLFQLDGVPYWQPSHGDIPIAGIPLEAISHIEVIRGPGTIFHGSNASAGVINIVTKSGAAGVLNADVTSNEGKQISAYNAFDLWQGTLDVSMHWRNRGQYRAFYNNRPVPAFFPVPPAPEGKIEKEPWDNSFMLKWHNENMVFQYHEFRSRLQGLAAAASMSNVSEMQQEGRLLRAEINWQANLGEFKTYLDYNNYFLRIPTANLFGGAEDGVQNFGSGADNNRIRLGTQYLYQWDSDNEFVAGLESEIREVGDYLNTDTNGVARLIAMPADETREWSAWAQWLKDMEQWRLTLGVRYVDNEKSGTKLLPRISLTNQFTAHSSLKILYSSGFNSPNFLQQGIDIPPNVIKGNPDLLAETIGSLDIAYTYTRANHLFIANVYLLQADDFIQRVSDGFEVQYQNTRHFHRYGLEVDYQFVSEEYRIHSNLAWQHKGNDVSEEDIGRLYVPELSFNLGFNWKITPHHQIGTSYRFIGERAAADSNQFLNIQYQYTNQHYELYVTAENILGDDYRVPDIQDFNPARLITAGDEDPVIRIGGRVIF